MTAVKQSHDATASTKGTIFQLYIALQKCFELKEGQKVIIERYGDVTSTKGEQIETKLYTDSLTDNHINFWKTLNNWMQPGFIETNYHSLILFTTQAFGVNCSFSDWNVITSAQRFAILEQIYQASQLREKERANDPQKNAAPTPLTLRIQGHVLSQKERKKLLSVLERFIIAAESPDITGVHQGLMDHYGMFVLKNKARDFVEALLGFVISPKIIEESTWEISKDEFDNKVRELIPLYMQGTRVFPTKYKREKPPTKEEIAALGKLFVKKIEEIQYHDVIPEAAMDYLYASDTVFKDLQNYNVPPQHFNNFKDEIRNHFEPLYRTRCRNVTNILKDSKDFYDAVVGSNPPAFPGFDGPNKCFRNGVVHMLCDDLTAKFQWKLEQS